MTPLLTLFGSCVASASRGPLAACVVGARPTSAARTLWRRLHLATRAAARLAAQAALGGLCAVAGAALAGEAAVPLAAWKPDAAVAPATATSATAVFAGGCFWGVQAVFQHTRGVLQALSGYAGGAPASAVYELVGSGLTGHAESVQVTYDPRQISYAQLLQIYFSVAHDPTQLNRQGPDHGSQYRSTVFYADATQQRTAASYIAQLDAAHVFGARIVTTLEPLKGFYPAEAYHQDYATLHPESGYIATFDAPKLVALKRMYPPWYRDDPVLVARTMTPKSP